MPRTILITGGAGFIGSNLVHHLRARCPDDRILILDLLTYAGSMESLPAEFRFMEDAPVGLWHGSVCNPTLVQHLVDRSDVVVHLAAETHVTRSIFDDRAFVETDVLGTQTLLAAVLRSRDRIQRFVHASTAEVYGTALADAIDEDHPLNPASPYAAAKCAADRLVYSYVRTHGIPATIARLFNTYGPRQHTEKVVPRFLTAAILGEPPTIHGDGTAERDFVHVDDTCRALTALLDAPLPKVGGEVFNIASGTARSVTDIARDVFAAAGAEAPRLRHAEDRPGQVARHRGDPSKVREVLGWSPATDWHDGLSAAHAWYLENREWWKGQLKLREISIRLPGGRTVPQ